MASTAKPLSNAKTSSGDMGQEAPIDRELSLGEVVSKTFRLYRRNALHYVAMFAVIGALVGIFTTILQSFFTIPAAPLNATPQVMLNFLPGFFGAVAGFAAVGFVVGVVFLPIAEGATIKMASDGVTGGTPRLGASLKFAASKLLSMWALSILVGVIVFVGVLALVVPGIILGIMFSLSLPALLIENKGVTESMGRSRQLVGHRWLKTFATFLVIGIVLVVVAVILSFISGFFGTAGTVVNDVLSALYQPVIPIATTVYYYSNAARTAQAQAGLGAATMVQQQVQKYCPNCGTPLTATTVFCPNCGARQPT